MTAGEAQALVAMVASAYPNQQFSQDSFNTYAAAISDLPVNEAKVAVAELCRTSEFFPTIAAIVGKVCERRLQLPPLAEAVRQLTVGRSKDDFHPLVWEARAAIGDSFDWRDRGDAIMVAQARKVYEDLRATRLREANLSSAGLLPAPVARPALEAVT